MHVQVDAASLFYSTRGTGPVCLVPTAIGTEPYERMLPAALGDRLTLVFVDLRGGGRSTGDPATLTFDRVADDLDAVRLDLGAARVAVLGHSVLGALAIEYGRRRPESVSHVIAVGTPPRGDLAWLSEAAGRFFNEDASEERKRVLAENLAALPAGASPGQMMLAGTPTRFFDARFDAAPLFAGAVARPGLLGHVMGPLTAAWDVTVGASSLSVPVLIAHGRYDYTVPHVLWRGVSDALPDATVEIFERSGHQPFFEEPDRFAEVVTAWMPAHPGNASGGVVRTTRP
jgi:proline iminopeptidase